MSLNIVSGPTSEPVTVDEVKARLRIKNADDDATIATHITAAREYAEKITRRSLAYKSYAYFMDRFPYPYEWHASGTRRGYILVPAPPLIAVTAIKYLDETLVQQTWDPAEYYVASMQSPGVIVANPGVCYPTTGCVPGAVEIDFTAGYDFANGPVCPEHLREGIRQLAVHIYEHPQAITSEGLKEAPLALMTFFRSNQIFVF